MTRTSGPCSRCACTLLELIYENKGWHWRCAYCNEATLFPVPFRRSSVFKKFAPLTPWASNWLTTGDVLELTEVQG